MVNEYVIALAVSANFALPTIKLFLNDRFSFHAQMSLLTTAYISYTHSIQFPLRRHAFNVLCRFMTKYLFLCAVGRSGTTVFRTALGQHPEIYYNGKENNAVHDILHVAQRNCSMKSRKFAMQVDQDRYDQIFRQTIEALTWPDEKKNSLPARLAAINPEGEQLDYLRQVFPGSKIICLVRNGIEVVSSRMAFESFAKDSFQSHCDVWNKSRSVIKWGRNHPDHFRLFRQEWFYQKDILKERLHETFQWAELSPSDLPLNHITETLRHPTGGTASIALNEFASTSEDEKKQYFLSKRDRWSNWSEDQRQMFFGKCGGFMEQLKYEIPW